MNDNPINTERRAAYIAGLRLLADVLDHHPELPQPSSGQSADNPLRIWFHSHHDQPSVRDRVAAAARALKRHARKVDKKINGEWFDVRTALAGLHIEVTTRRNDVCERVVIGTETVTEKHKDPDLLAQVPEVEVTEEREIVEWRCPPSLLAEAGTAVTR